MIGRIAMLLNRFPWNKHKRSSVTTRVDSEQLTDAIQNLADAARLLADVSDTRKKADDRAFIQLMNEFTAVQEERNTLYLGQAQLLAAILIVAGVGVAGAQAVPLPYRALALYVTAAVTAALGIVGLGQEVKRNLLQFYIARVLRAKTQDLVDSLDPKPTVFGLHQFMNRQLRSRPSSLIALLVLERAGDFATNTLVGVVPLALLIAGHLTDVGRVAGGKKSPTPNLPNPTVHAFAPWIALGIWIAMVVFALLDTWFAHRIRKSNDPVELVP